MAIGKNVVCLANGYSLADAITKLGFSAEQKELDASVVANSYQSYETGFKSGMLKVDGIFDSDSVTVDKIHDVFSAVYTSGANVTVTSSLGTVTTGADALMLTGCTMKYDMPMDTGALIFSNAEFKAKTGVNFGKWLMNSQLNAGTTNGAAVDGLAASTNGGLFQVHLHNTDATDVDVKVQHSTTGVGAWVDLAAVNDLSSTHAADFATVAAGTTVNRYLRAVAVVTDGNTELVSAAFARR